MPLQTKMHLERLKLNKRTLSAILKQVWSGKSLARSFMNVSLLSEKLRGECLDLGSKSSAASYNRFLQKEDSVKKTYTDFHQSGEGIVKMDLEKNFPIEDSQYNTVTCFNVLEHIYNYRNVVNESYRVLSPGGQFIGGVPFLVNYHADPHDYFRYTHETLVKTFTYPGFKLKKMVFLGYGPVTAGLALYMNIFPKFLRPFVVLEGFFIDLLILRFKKSQRMRYALGYTFVFIKEQKAMNKEQ